MLQQADPDDYVIASGRTRSVQEFAEAAFACVNLDWRDYVVVDPRFFRPAEVQLLLGDPTKAMRRLAWEPTCSFQELVEEMVQEDLARLSKANNSKSARSRSLTAAS
jgi:GDPmannose 4,6-dehydratase